MSIEQLAALRDSIDVAIKKRVGEAKRELETKLSELDRFGEKPRKKGPLKGSKASPKYRGPGGETWAGRGMRPKWLSALVKKGQKPEEFLIKKTAASSGKKGR